MDNIWYTNYPHDVAHAIDPNIYPSLVELIDYCCVQYRDNIAYTHEGTTLTYQEVEQYSRYFATFLQQYTTKGTHVGIILPNLLQYPVALFGILRAGCVAVNTNPLYTEDELVSQLADAEVEIVVAFSPQPHLKAALQRLPSIKHVILTEGGDLFPPIKRLIVNAYIKHVKYRKYKLNIPQAISWLDALKIGQSTSFNKVTLSGDNVALLQYTGGTTGISKGAMLTHRNLVANILQTAAWISPLQINSSDCIITALPLYHIFSLLANCFLFFYLGANNLLITDPRDTKGLIKRISNSKATAITGVNTLFASLVNNPSFPRVAAARFKIALSGGMALQPTIAALWLQLAQKPIIEAYGLTEASPAVSINPITQTAYNGSIGLPLPSTEISIRDPLGIEVALETDGELCVRGPQVMAGYWQQSAETANVFWSDGFLRTGDKVYMDKAGFIYMRDRIKDMILVSGFNVYPHEIEQVLQMHPLVLEVGVVGVRGEHGEEIIKACIVKRDATLTSDDILNYAKIHLTGYKIPKIIAFYAELPKTNVGKILRRVLS